MNGGIPFHPVYCSATVLYTIFSPGSRDPELNSTCKAVLSCQILFELAGETKHRMQQPQDDASTHNALPRRDTNKFQRGILNRRLLHEEELIFTHTQKKIIRKETCAKVDVQ